MSGASFWVKKAKQLSAEADSAERDLENPNLTNEQRLSILVKTNDLRKQSREEEKGARLVTSYQLSKFGKKTGSKTQTLERIAYVQGISAEIGNCKRQALANAIWKDERGKELFGTWETLYRFLGRSDIFDSNGNGQT